MVELNGHLQFVSFYDESVRQIDNINSSVGRPTTTVPSRLRITPTTTVAKYNNNNSTTSTCTAI